MFFCIKVNHVTAWSLRRLRRVLSLLPRVGGFVGSQMAFLRGGTKKRGCCPELLHRISGGGGGGRSSTRMHRPSTWKQRSLSGLPSTGQQRNIIKGNVRTRPASAVTPASRLSFSNFEEACEFAFPAASASIVYRGVSATCALAVPDLHDA